MRQTRSGCEPCVVGQRTRADPQTYVQDVGFESAAFCIYGALAQCRLFAVACGAGEVAAGGRFL